MTPFMFHPNADKEPDFGDPLLDLDVLEAAFDDADYLPEFGDFDAEPADPSE